MITKYETTSNEQRTLPSKNQELLLLRQENKRLKRTSFSLAHDLKNHIQALLWTIESSEDIAKREKLYNRLLYQTIAMKDAVGMIMESANSYALRSSAEPISIITETAQSFNDQIELKINQKDLSKTHKVEASILRQIILNLISNSIKHSGKNPVIAFINLRCLNHRILFSYSDNGIGLPEYMARKLNELQPAKNPGADSGTGLWLIRELVSESGGTFKFENKNLQFDLPVTLG